MKTFDPKKAIVSATAALAENIRTYARSQKELWQLVPWLALEADGRSGYLDNYSRAYHLGVWALRASCSGGSYSVYVDLATGELIRAGTFHWDQGKLMPASDDEILMPAANIEELDAASIVKELQKESKKAIAKFYDPDKQAAWRKETRREHGLKPVYTAAQRGPVELPSIF